MWLQPPHKVDLSNAEKTIMVQLLKTSAALSVVSNYKQLAKFNVRELSTTDEEQQKAVKAAASGRKDEKDSTAGKREEEEAAAPVKEVAAGQPEKDTADAMPSTAQATDGKAAENDAAEPAGKQGGEEAAGD